MGDLNHVSLTGRVVRDAELKRKGVDLVLCEFTIANNYSKKVGETWSRKANFFNLAVFGKMAESSTNEYPNEEETFHADHY